MAKKQRIEDDEDPIMDSDYTPPEGERIVEEAEDVAARVAVDSVAAMVANSSTIRIHRKTVGNKMAFLESWDPAIFTPDRVKAEFGGGDYIFIACDAAGKMIKRVAYPIDGEPRSKTVELAKSTQPDNNKFMELFILMNKESRDREMQQQQMQNQMMIAMIQSLNGQKANHDPFDMLMKFKMAFPDNTEKLLGMFKEGMAMATPKDDEKPVWLDVLTAVAPAIVPGLMGAQPQAPVPQITNISPPNPQPVPPTAAQPPAQNMLFIDVTKLVARLISAAKEKLSVEAIGKEFIDKIESMSEAYKEVDADYIYDFIESDTWFEDLVNLTKAKQPHMTPIIEEHKAYLFKLREAVLYFLDDDHATGDGKDKDDASSSANGAD